VDVTIGGHSFRYPNGPTDLLLGEWVTFIQEAGRPLDLAAAQVEALPKGPIQILSAMKLYADRAYAVAAWFAGMDQEEATAAFPLQTVTNLYRVEFAKCFVAEPRGPIEWNDKVYELPPAALDQGSAMTFGEIVDSKAMVQNSQQLQWSQWELVQRICAIFLRHPEEQYDEQLGYLTSARAAEMATLPIGYAMMVSEWFEELNEFLQNFTVFLESSMKSGAFMKKHFEHWGWVNFLKSIAKTKVFDIAGSGMNSVQCARRAKAFDVLMFASEEKEYSEAMQADFEAKAPK
jgi:hypothetical protein